MSPYPQPAQGVVQQCTRFGRSSSVEHLLTLRLAFARLRKSRKTVEGFQSQQASIEADRKAIDEAKAKLDDPEAKAASNQYSDLKSQLDKLTGQADEVHASRNKLFEQRDANKKKLDDLYSKKREVKDAFRSANDAYCSLFRTLSVPFSKLTYSVTSHQDERRPRPQDGKAKGREGSL